MRKPLILLTVPAAVTLALGCSDSTNRTSPRQGLVLYTRGLSSDPYGNSQETGFGVVARIGTSEQWNVEIEGRGLGSFGGVEWISDERIVVPRGAPPLRRPFLYRFDGRALRRLGVVPVSAREPGASWSPDGRLIASQPIEPCKRRQRSVWRCYRGSGRVLVRNADGTHPRVVARARFLNVDKWTPDGRVLVTAGHTYAALDVHTGRRSVPLVSRRVAARFGLGHAWLSAPRWSADGRYLAAMISGDLQRRRVTGAVLLAQADGRPIRLITSPYIISMFAWSPAGHRLAYTTSGFPAPHQLLLVDGPKARPKTLFETIRHFDWVTWSPDGRWLLVDDEHADRWRLVRTAGRRVVRSLPRLGGRPFWCCPTNAYETN
jgi:Tol biopolymer transport system component